MDLRSPVRRLTLLTVATAVAYVVLRMALNSVAQNSGAHDVLTLAYFVVALAVVGFAWALASALITDRRSKQVREGQDQTRAVHGDGSSDVAE